MDETIFNALVDEAERGTEADFDVDSIVRDVLTKLAELTPPLRTQEEVRRILGLTGEDA